MPPTDNPPPKRVRTPGQLGRKRLKDREAMRVKRATDRGRMEYMEATIKQLQDQVTQLADHHSHPTATHDPADDTGLAVAQLGGNDSYQRDSSSIAIPGLLSGTAPGQNTNHPVLGLQVDEGDVVVGLSASGATAASRSRGNWPLQQPAKGLHIPLSVMASSPPRAPSQPRTQSLWQQFREAHDRNLVAGEAPSTHTWSPAGHELHASRSHSHPDPLVDDHPENQQFYQRAARALLSAHTNMFTEQEASESWLPALPALENICLLNPQQSATVEVINSAFTDIRIADEQTHWACYILMYKLMRYRMYPCPEFYRDIPECMRPTPKQENIPHPIGIDFLVFPRLRDALVDRPEIYQKRKREFETNFTKLVRLQWPKSKPILVPNYDGEIELDPTFEAFAENLDHWALTDEWHEIYPEFSELVNRMKN